MPSFDMGMGVTHQRFGPVTNNTFGQGSWRIIAAIAHERATFETFYCYLSTIQFGLFSVYFIMVSLAHSSSPGIM